MDEIYDEWNVLKKRISKSEKVIYCKTREIWWCSVGMNVGTELYGKNELFERPTLVVKVFSKESVLIIPMTTKSQSENYALQIELFQRPSWIVISQMRVVSTKRMSRKIGKISRDEYKRIINKITSILKNEKPPFGGLRSPKAE